MKTLQIFVSGRVQGVCFRDYTKREAERLRITGWVRNGVDGRVEILAQGETSALDEFKIWCHKGSPWAEVKEVQVKETDSADQFSDFTIRH